MTVQNKIDKEILLKAFELMLTAEKMALLYEENKEICSKYVHATSRGHEAIQLALSLQLKPFDYVFPYYRDDSILLGMGFTPYDLMLQVLAKKDDPFSGGRTYYSHPSVRRDDMPKVPHQSSATGMQAIPATGLAHGIHYLESQELLKSDKNEAPVVVCSLGDASITEGEVAEAFQMAVLKKLPILYFIQDNEWDISASADEIRAMDAAYYARGFKGLEVVEIDGTDFEASYLALQDIVKKIREERRPFLLHAKVPLLGHHTSGVRKEWYRGEENLKEHALRDPLPKMRTLIHDTGFESGFLETLENEIIDKVAEDYQKALAAADPEPSDLFTHIFAPTEITEEKGIRKPEGGQVVMMVDAALHAVEEILREHPEALLYGQDVGGRLGGVFREAALLAKKFGDSRVFNTPIQEAYIIGSTTGMSAAGCKPIVEVQFADYIWPGLNQLFTEVSRSNYLSDGKWPVQALIRVPIGAYGSGGPYHSSSVESVIAQIKGVKVVYPSNAADMKGLMKAAFYDPNPVVIFEHKGLYWSKVPGTSAAKTVEPDADYVVPIGKAAISLEAASDFTEKGKSVLVVTYGMGVHWALNAAKKFKDQVEIVDLRTLHPIDDEFVFERVKKHHKVLLLTEESLQHSLTEALAGRIAKHCFEYLDAPVQIIGSENTPAIPLNSTLENTYLPTQEDIENKLDFLLKY
ncbi:MAG: tungsten formylmethanofuran dehydrogenase [Chitinophagaceae bacterium]|nr:MAG: tungsten formylmethanofuran dehydrogenase [Chitinophagaceae bacterium]